MKILKYILFAANPAGFIGRIYGGENISIKERPYQVSIESKPFGFCGGSIISSNYVVTAAHCFLSKDPDSHKVRVGTDVMGKFGRLHEVEYVKLHENYSYVVGESPKNDIAVIRVKQPFKFTEKCQPIELVKRCEKVKAGVISVTSGWGWTDEGETEKLKSLAMPAYDRDLCNEIYTDKPNEVLEGYICAGIFGVKNRSGCFGDSGGPMTINGRLAGIVSWIDECGSPKYPTVYTDVSYYHDWIFKNIKV